MKTVLSLVGKSIPVLVSTILITLTPEFSRAEIRPGQVLVKAVSGEVTCTLPQEGWKPLAAGDYLPRGAVIKTGPNSTADLIVEYNGTVLRLLPDSNLEFAKLDKEQAGDDMITETHLKLVAGAIVGSQRKLPKPSRLIVQVPGGEATIVGTEYVVRADGAVTVLSGAVSVNYNMPGKKGDVKAIVPAGFSFDPASGQVVPTSPDYLVNIIAHINTVKNNALTFKAGGANVVVKPEPAGVVSPSTPTPRTIGNRTRTP